MKEPEKEDDQNFDLDISIFEGKEEHSEFAQKLKEKCQVKFGHYIKIEGKAVSVCKVKQLHIDKIEYKPVDKKGSNY